jgi:hypothetical protein
MTVALALYLWAALSCHGAEPALAAVNAKRAAKGLKPFIEDPGLTVAAVKAADFRARLHLFGHTSNDFQFLPAGVHASSAGCAGNEVRYGFMACDMYDNYTYAGAAWALGSDNRLYCHIFVRGGSGSSTQASGKSSFFTAAPRRLFRR